MKKNILITGASRGIGQAIRDRFLKIDLKSRMEQQLYLPSRSEMDVSSETSISDYLSMKNINIIINCAGVNNLNQTLSPNEMDVNFNGPRWIIEYCLEGMKNNNFGRILNIGSIWIDIARQGRGKYSISKSALHSYTKQIAVEYGQYNILANTLSPGFIETDMTYNNNTEEELALIQSEIPIRRLGNPSEVAELAWFLTMNNTYINGQNIIIDGGYSICA